MNSYADAGELVGLDAIYAQLGIAGLLAVTILPAVITLLIIGYFIERRNRKKREKELKTTKQKVEDIEKIVTVIGGVAVTGLLLSEKVAEKQVKRTKEQRDLRQKVIYEFRMRPYKYSELNEELDTLDLDFNDDGTIKRG